MTKWRVDRSRKRSIFRQFSWAQKEVKDQSFYSTVGRLSQADDEWTVVVVTQLLISLSDFVSDCLDFRLLTFDCPGSKCETFDWLDWPKWMPSKWDTLFSKRNPPNLVLGVALSLGSSKIAGGEVLFWKWAFVLEITLFSFLRQRNRCFTYKTTSDPAFSNFFLANLLDKNYIIV